jgi:hypothetical protein
MGFVDWLADSIGHVREAGFDGLKYAVNLLYMGALRRVLPSGGGENVFSKEWDVLLILDACRTDVLADVAPDYPFLDTPGTHRSTASTSREWMETTFVDEYRTEMADTVYVTANPYSRAVDSDQFHAYEPLYDYGWDEELSTVPAETVTDVAVRSWREHGDDADRMIVHYMQPHLPSVPHPLTYETEFLTGWQGLLIGNVDPDELWTAYERNLEYVLDSVQLLLRNLEAETVAITADHGNAKGEGWVYGHPYGIPLDCLRTVPWYTTSGTDDDTYTPERHDRQEADAEIEDRLAALGYR